MKKTNTNTYKILLLSVMSFTLFLTFFAPFSALASVDEYRRDEPSVPAQLLLDQQSERFDKIQIFDVALGEVVRVLPNSKEVQKEAKSWLKQLKQFAPEVQPDMKAKFIVRIPLSKPETIRISSQQIDINEMFVFYYPDKKPILLVFDSSRKPFLFHLDSNLSAFWKKLNIS